MPSVTYTSWAMEELLEPWVHFVPINDSLSDVEEKVQWVIDHSDQAQAIAHAGKLWISDLVYHPHADDDDGAIMREIFLRYKQHFIHEPDLASFDNLAFG
jgi:Glycosyl transferase family 90